MEPSYSRPASSLDLTQLRYFRGIARAGNMTRAARSLRVSQPTVSLAVKHLEASLGTTLFLRHRTGVSLTASGAELLRHVDEVMLVLDRATERITNLDRGLTGTFTIGCHESIAAYFLPRFLDHVLIDAPDVVLSLRDASSQAVLDAVVSRDVHFGVVVNPRPHPDVVLIELFRDAIDVFVAAPDGDIDLEEARAYVERRPLIYPSRVDGCAALLEQLDAAGLASPRRLECGDFGLAKSLVLSAVGPALLPRRIAAHRSRGQLQRLHHGLPVFEHSIQLAFRCDLHRTRAATYVKDELIRSAREMGPVSL